MDFDKPKVYGDTSITDGLVLEIVDIVRYATIGLESLAFFFPVSASAAFTRRE